MHGTVVVPPAVAAPIAVPAAAPTRTDWARSVLNTIDTTAPPAAPIAVPLRALDPTLRFRSNGIRYAPALTTCHDPFHWTDCSCNRATVGSLPLAFCTDATRTRTGVPTGSALPSASASGSCDGMSTSRPLRSPSSHTAPAGCARNTAPDATPGHVGAAGGGGGGGGGGCVSIAGPGTAVADATCG